MDAFDTSNPVAVMFGTVISASPLEVNVDQRYNLTENFLIIPERLMYLRGIDERFQLEIKGNVKTGPAVDEESDEEWTSQMRIWGEEMEVTRRGELPLGRLKEGDQLILLRMQGGQKYLVLDRVWQG